RFVSEGDSYWIVVGHVLPGSHSSPHRRLAGSPLFYKAFVPEKRLSDRGYASILGPNSTADDRGSAMSQVASYCPFHRQRGPLRCRVTRSNGTDSMGGRARTSATRTQ